MGAITLSELSVIANQVGGIGNGGDIEITTYSLSVTDGAFLFASTGGRGNAGNVRITASDTVSFAGVGNDGNSSGAFSQVTSRGNGKGGDVEITSYSLSITNGARLSASTFGRGDAGNVRIIATDTVSFAGVGSNGRSSGADSAVGLGGEGKGGNVEITARSLSVTDGAFLSANTSGRGDAGNVRIQASDTVSLAGVGSNRRSSVASSQVAQEGEGNGGNVEITTNSLALADGARVSASTGGRGDAGTVRITATETISFSGVGSNGLPSGAASQVAVGGQGKGGDVEITTNSFAVTNGAQLSAGTFGRGNAGTVRITATETISFAGVGSNGDPSGAFSSAESGSEGNGGNVEINTRSLSVTDGAQLSVLIRERGDAGNVRITATDRVSFSGMASNGAPSGAFSSVERDAEGKGGDVEITTGSLFLADAVIASRSEGIGRAGDIMIQTRENLELNRSQIRATTRFGDGGDITLQVGDLLLMRNNSLISTTAGTAQAGGDGGNIKINADFIVAVPKENSDITANAFEGRGGNINITAQGIYGLEFRPHLTPLSDITASSDFGVDGVVEINTPDIDPSQGLANLPSEPVNTEVAQDCQVIGGKTTSSFISTGSGGLPTNPYEPLDSREILAEIQPPAQWTSNSVDAASSSTSPKTTREPIIEAQGWIINEKGEVVLVAEVPPAPSASGCRLR
jgi:large exoprotein involved in heme utilization and adhesion